jgi:hypothetical protein
MHCTYDIISKYNQIVAHSCKLGMKNAKFGIIDQHMNATC